MTENDNTIRLLAKLTKQNSDDFLRLAGRPLEDGERALLAIITDQKFEIEELKDRLVILGMRVEKNERLEERVRALEYRNETVDKLMATSLGDL